MKKLIAILVCILVSEDSFAAIAIVQTVGKQCTGSPCAATVTSTGAGHLGYVVCAGISATGVPVATDGASSSYTAVDSVSNGTFGSSFSVANNLSGGATTVTCTLTGATVTAIEFREYSGFATSGTVDVHAISAITTGTNAASGTTGTTSQANELVLGGVTAQSAGVTITAGSGYGNLSTNGVVAPEIAIEDKTVAATGTQQAVFANASMTYAADVITLKIPSAVKGSVGCQSIMGMNKGCIMGAAF